MKRFYSIVGTETVIVDSDAVYGGFEPAERCGRAVEQPERVGPGYREFIENVLARLPPTYRAVTEARGRGRDSAVIAESRFYEIRVAEGEGNLYLSVAPREGADSAGGPHPLAVANLPRAAAAVFLRLLLVYPLRVRDGPWATAPYRPFAERSAA